MEPVITPREMVRIESMAFEEGFEDEDFMEDAGEEVAAWVTDYLIARLTPKKIALLCGKGNNGGDAYVTGRKLIEKGFEVKAFQLAPQEEGTPLLQKNLARFQSVGGEVILPITIDECDFDDTGLFIDGIFGTGFQGTASGLIAQVIDNVNILGKPIISIDIPSGLDGETGEALGSAIVATETVYLGLSKIGFFIRDGWNYVGRLRLGDFGLPLELFDLAHSEAVMLEPGEMRFLLPKVVRTRDKYQAGYVVALAGSPGMPGAANLASFASLRAGAGIVRLLHPKGMEVEFANAPSEIVRIPYDYQRPEFGSELISKASAALIGPGIGRSEPARDYLEEILQNLVDHPVPVVIDADALFHIANDLVPPQGAILTPHRGEMNRLLKLEEGVRVPFDQTYWNMCREYAEKHKIVLILKGGPTVIFDGNQQDAKPILCPLGSPGMATAGSGDVLTGVIAGLLAQGLQPIQAAKLGVYLHGMAGELAEESYTVYGMTAGDLIDLLPDAFKTLIDFTY